MYLEEWEEYQSILREMKTTALVQKRYKKQGAQALAQLDKGGQPNTAPYTKARPPRGKSGLGPMEEEVSVVPEIKEDLNRDIWNDSGKLKPEIADKLVRIAEDFYKKLELPAPV